MKKIMIVGIVIATIVVLSATAAAISQPLQKNMPYYIESDNPALKVLFGVNHEFPDVFSTELTPIQAHLLSKIDIKVEPVQLYQIEGRPICGDGLLHPSEQCGEPGYTCLEGYVCENCKCVEETVPSKRTYYPSTQTPWGIVKVNGGSGGAGVTVAVLDTGVYKNHLDLKANIVACKDATKRGIRGSCADGNGHGTHVAGTIVASGGSDGKGIFGVAPEAKLIVIKVCGNNGFCRGDDIAAAIRYATNSEANIISMSIGGDMPDLEISKAVDYAYDKGVLIIAAAGNDGSADGSIDYPGAHAKVVAVGAIDSDENVPDWSSRGIYIDPVSEISEREIELGAPGVYVESTFNDGGYRFGSGTSMATPHIAGLAAKVWNTDAATTRAELQELAQLHDLYIEGYDTATGFGLPIAS